MASSHPPGAAAAVPPHVPEFFLFVLFFDFRRRHGQRKGQRKGVTVIRARLAALLHVGFGLQDLMQHYGAPTRLLDWTDGALIALYFAVQPHVEDDDYANEDAAVWVLDPLRLNQKSLGTPERPHVPVLTPHSSRAQKYLPKAGTRTTPIPKSPIAIDPPHVSKRLAVQRSRFVLFGSNQDGIEKVMSGDDRLTKIPIDSESCKMIYRDLLTCRLSRNTLFPDLEGLGGELARAWRVNSLYR